MVDVFISYSRADQAMVAALARAVEAEGYDVWWDAELPPHQSYGEVITDKIEQTKAAIVVWSGTAVKSEWVRAEADLARHHRKLIQIAIDAVTPPLPFNQIQYAVMADWRGEPDHPGWTKVKRSLAELCGRNPASQPPRPIPATAPPRPAPASTTAPPAAAPTGAPAAVPSRWPLYAGIGVGLVGLGTAAALFLGQHASVPPAASASETPAVAPARVDSAAPAQASAQSPGFAIAPPSQPLSEPAAAPVAAADNGQAQPNPGDLSFPDSSTRLLQRGEVAQLGPSTLRFARNEIYARKGRRFVDQDLRDYFGKFAWYHPRYDEVTLNPIEQRNVALLQQAEQRYQ